MQMKSDEIVGLAGKHGLSLAPETVQLEESGADFLAAFADGSAGRRGSSKMNCGRRSPS